MNVFSGAALVGFGWWLCRITTKTDYVPLPVFESKVTKKARLGRKKEEEATAAANDDSYTDVLNDEGER